MTKHYKIVKNKVSTEKERYIENQIIFYMENKYLTKIHACVLNYEEFETIASVMIFFEKNDDYKQILERYRHTDFGLNRFPEDGTEIGKIFKQNGFKYNTKLDEGYRLLYYSFEECALENCYAESSQGFDKFREKHFNPKTMEKINPSALFVTYKSKELMEEAERNGEQQKLIDEYYKFIKKYDEHNFITKQKGLLFYFDYPEIALHPRSYSDLYWQRMTRSINDCAVLKEYNLTINSQIYNQKTEEK